MGLSRLGRDQGPSSSGNSMDADCTPSSDCTELRGTGVVGRTGRALGWCLVCTPTGCVVFVLKGIVPFRVPFGDWHSQASVYIPVKFTSEATVCTGNSHVKARCLSRWDGTGAGASRSLCSNSKARHEEAHCAHRDGLVPVTSISHRGAWRGRAGEGQGIFVCVTADNPTVWPRRAPPQHKHTNTAWEPDPVIARCSGCQLLTPRNPSRWLELRCRAE